MIIFLIIDMLLEIYLHLDICFSYWVLTMFWEDAEETKIIGFFFTLSIVKAYFGVHYVYSFVNCTRCTG